MPAIKPKLSCIPGLALALLAALFLLAAAAFAQTPAPPEKRLDQVRLQLDQIQASLTRADQSDLAMQGLRAQLDPLALTVQQVVAELSPKLDAVKVRIDVLKPKTPDKPAIAAAPAPKPAEDKPAVQEKPAAEPDAAAGELADQDKSFKDIDTTLRRARPCSSGRGGGGVSPTAPLVHCFAASTGRKFSPAAMFRRPR